jgi:predicted PolB exonuclease-like 3'-5' exonuclease
MSQAAPSPKHVESLVEIPAGESGLFTAYASLMSARSGRTSQNKRYVDLEVSDQSTTLGGKIWDDAAPAQDAALSIPRGRPVKLLFQPGSYQGVLQLTIKGIREIDDDDTGTFRPEVIFGEGIDLVEDLLCDTLVFDIETVPAHDKRELPSTVAESLVKFSEYKDMETAAVMGMSPLFGKVVSLAFGEGESELSDQLVSALVVAPEGTDVSSYPEWMRPMTEPDLLRAFWVLAGAASNVVTYNGRGFDVPFLINRSLIHGIPARVDLLSNRYSLRPHLDLLQVLRHGSYGSGPTTLDVVCWALGIESPKGEMDGSMVAPAYARGEIEEIARYNLADVRATTAVYQNVRDGLLRYRKDW